MTRFEHGLKRVRNAINREAIRVAEGNIGEGGGELLSVKLFWCHGMTEVEQDIDLHVFFEFKEFDDELLEARGNIPVNISEVVALIIFLVIGKGGSAALLITFAVSFEFPIENFACQEGKHLETLDELWIG